MRGGARRDGRSRAPLPLRGRGLLPLRVAAAAHRHHLRVVARGCVRSPSASPGRACRRAGRCRCCCKRARWMRRASLRRWARRGWPRLSVQVILPEPEGAKGQAPAPTRSVGVQTEERRMGALVSGRFQADRQRLCRAGSRRRRSTSIISCPVAWRTRGRRPRRTRRRASLSRALGPYDTAGCCPTQHCIRVKCAFCGALFINDYRRRS